MVIAELAVGGGVPGLGPMPGRGGEDAREEAHAALMRLRAVRPCIGKTSEQLQGVATGAG